MRYALLVVLGYSRLLWCRFYPRQDMGTLIDGLEDAFFYFGGVPQELLFDQMKAVITRDLRLQGGGLVRNAEFLRFARHWGFTPRVPTLSRPDKRQSRAAGALRARQFRVRPHLSPGCGSRRVHGTTRERPRVRFDREERFLLQPLTARRYTSLILDRPLTSTPAPPSPRPVVTVEKRSLAAYARLAGGAA